MQFQRPSFYGMDSPLVSIVTPSFNQAQFLEETLRSVERQRYRPIQQIVIDGGSTDGSVEALKRWEAIDHGSGYTFEWISEPDRGHADALNKGFDRVRGDIVGWLNSDDVYFDTRAITDVIAVFQKRPGIDVVHGEVALISEDSGLQMILCYPQFRYKRALRGFMVSQPALFLRRIVTDTHRLDPTLKIAIDHVYWLQIGKQHRFRKLDRVLAGDRDHGARITRMSHVALMETSKQACANFGGRESGPLQQFLDLLLLRLLRVDGLLHMISLLSRDRSLRDLAFPGWIDSVPNVLRRQLLMRVNDRGNAGPTRNAASNAAAG